MARMPIPFAEGAPPDNLMVEEFGDDEVLIGDPSVDEIPEIDTQFDANIAEDISESELAAKADSLI